MNTIRKCSSGFIVEETTQFISKLYLVLKNEYDKKILSGFLVEKTTQFI